MDDDPSVRKFYRDLFRSCGYVPLVVKSGDDALRLLSAREEEVAIVVSDYAMPNMDGASLAARIKHRHPGLPVILVTASLQIREDLAHCIDAVVEKPCPPQGIIDQIRALLERQTGPVETEPSSTVDVPKEDALSSRGRRSE